tara:strand:- start:35656 stop:36198 length:543 start_codon:yes stop_codon:yes gene_type:complete
MEQKKVKARAIGHYAVIVPDVQGENHTSKGIVIANGKAPFRFLTGKVIALGSRVPEGVSVGQSVMYERQSGHPGQTGPIDASIFGGEEGKHCVLVPVYKGALKSVADIEEEFHKHKIEVDALKIKDERRGLNSIDLEKLGFHDRRMSELVEMRRGRARGYQRKSIGDKAKGSGVVAILER